MSPPGRGCASEPRPGAAPGEGPACPTGAAAARRGEGGGGGGGTGNGDARGGMAETATAPGGGGGAPRGLPRARVPYPAPVFGAPPQTPARGVCACVVLHEAPRSCGSVCVCVEWECVCGVGGGLGWWVCGCRRGGPLHARDGQSGDRSHPWRADLPAHGRRAVLGGPMSASSAAASLSPCLGISMAQVLRCKACQSNASSRNRKKRLPVRLRACSRKHARVWGLPQDRLTCRHLGGSYDVHCPGPAPQCSYCRQCNCQLVWHHKGFAWRLR